MNEGMYYVMAWDAKGVHAFGQFSTRLSAIRCAKARSKDPDYSYEHIYVVEVQGEYQNGGRVVNE